jgi:DNA-binding beta-propeller fold protein YncE
VAYGADGSLAVTAANGAVQVTDPAGKPRATLRVGDWPGDATFSPDGSLLAVTVRQRLAEDLAGGPERNEIVVWETATRRRLGVVSTGDAAVNALAFAADGQKLVAAATLSSVVNLEIKRQGEIRTWRLPDLVPAGTRSVGPFEPADLDVSPDGRTLAVVGGSRRIELYGLDSDGPPRVSPPTTTALRGVAFAPDGRTLATLTAGGTTVQLWDVGTLAVTARLTGHANDVYAVEFAPDGGLLATGAADTSVALWQLDPDTAARRLCDIMVPASRARGEQPPPGCPVE